MNSAMAGFFPSWKADIGWMGWLEAFQPTSRHCKRISRGFCLIRTFYETLSVAWWSAKMSLERWDPFPPREACCKSQDHRHPHQSRDRGEHALFKKAKFVVCHKDTGRT